MFTALKNTGSHKALWSLGVLVALVSVAAVGCDNDRSMYGDDPSPTAGYTDNTTGNVTRNTYSDAYTSNAGMNTTTNSMNAAMNTTTTNSQMNGADTSRGVQSTNMDNMETMQGDMPEEITNTEGYDDTYNDTYGDTYDTSTDAGDYGSENTMGDDPLTNNSMNPMTTNSYSE